MVRRKQPRPTRPTRPSEGAASDEEEQSDRPTKRPRKQTSSEAEEVTWRDAFLPEISGEDAKDVAEICLQACTPATGFEGLTWKERVDLALRVRVRLPMDGKVKFGSLQEVSKQDLRVQVLIYSKSATAVTNVHGVGDEDHCSTQELTQDPEIFTVLISGEIDAPDAVITSLAYLIRLEYISLRPAPCLTCELCRSLDHNLSGRLRVLISEKAFVGSESYSRRSPWQRAMQTVVFWLRPELVSLTRIKRFSKYDEEITDNIERMIEVTGSSKQRVFDPSALYDAIKPSWTGPVLNLTFPELLPNLRPYQHRAVCWMVHRERGYGARHGPHPDTTETSTDTTSNHQSPSTSAMRARMRRFPDEHPMWLSLLPQDGSSELFFNPYTGAVSLAPHDFVTYVKGGILADEMGLGKTVELLACILANPYKDLSARDAVEASRSRLLDKLAKRKRERVECACGATEDDEDYTQPWVQCDVCDAWQHSTCVGIARPEPKRQGDNGSLSSGKRLRTLVIEDNFFCGVCAEIIGSVEVVGDSRTTLVVCPAPILQQWQDEIVRHTRPGSLRIIVYEGVEKGAYLVMDDKDVGNIGRLKVVSAQDLASADIVLTTYDTLRTDLSHDSDKTKSNQRSLRYIKRYPVVPTPLTRLRWWRVCLDEAQMVEGSTTKATEMALLLSAQNRWCVSGSPIQRGLDDLFGLLRFLQAEPFDNYQNWNQVLREPYEAGDAEMVIYMHKFLGMLMWRSTKALVKDELNIPAQEERLSWLRFSPVEAHFYRQQHEKCATKAREMIAKYARQHNQHRAPITGEFAVVQSTNSPFMGTQGRLTSSLSNIRPDSISPTDGPALEERREGSQSAGVASAGTGTADPATTNVVITNDLTVRSSDLDTPLSHSESSMLSTSLLRLRQACCHPQVGSAGIRSLHQRSPMTMDDILQVLVDKAKIEAEEAQRVLMGALNGLAALAAIDSNIPLAVSIYREALAFTEENAADIDVDPLQKLHTLHNLADVLGLSSSDTWTEGNVSNGGHEAEPALFVGAVKSTDAGNAGSASLTTESVSVCHSIIGNHSTVSREKGKASGLEKLTNIPVGGANFERPVAGKRLLGFKVPRTLRDDVLIEQSQEIRSKYMASFQARLENALAEFEIANQQVSEATKDCEESGGTCWWLEVLTSLENRSGGGADLLNKIRSHLLETDNLGKRGRHQNASSLALSFREIAGLKYVVQRELHALGSARNQVLERLNALNLAMKNPTAQDSERIANCPRDSENTTGSLCAHCEMDDLFKMYENRLLLLRTSAAKADGLVTAEDAAIAQHRILAHKRINGFKDQGIAGRDQSMDVDTDLVRNRRGATEIEVLRAPSETEQILSIIKAQAGRAGGERDAATKHLHVFETMKKEYSQMRALAKVQREVLYSLDEINMATTRLTLKLPGEVVENEVEKLVKLHFEEVPQRNVQLTIEKFDALKDFSRAKGQLRYLKGLSWARQQEQRRRTSGTTGTLPGSPQGRPTSLEGWHHDEETCPVCHDKLGSQLMVLPCGHLLCCKCCMVMIDRTHTPPNGNSRKCIPCPTCRQRTYVADIAYVDNGNERNEIATQMGQLHEGARADEEASLQVKGSYGTKIEAVLRRLLWVLSKDQDAKILIFSTWHEVLDVIQHALSVNRITHARVKGAKLNEPIQRFRGVQLPTANSRHKRVKALDTDNNVNVLLLPIERGGNGLNLVEAQHVILVEPSPNPALEAQAINRVHRIGQTRATYVHRFIVNDTVEESVYWLGRSRAELAEKFPGSGAGARKRGGFVLTLNAVTALFSSESPSEADGNSMAAQHSNVSAVTPAAAAAAAAEARLRQQVASQEVSA